jgi:hypothetical protein
METIDYYMTDFGPIAIDGAVSAAIPKRKNGDFDMRYRVSKSAVAQIREHARTTYLSQEDWSKRFFAPSLT